jgi:hypothetical protein
VDRGLALVLIAGRLTDFAAAADRSKKEQQLETNIDQQKGVNAVIGNLITNQQQVVNNAANNTNKAIGDLGNSVNRPSNQFDGNRANDRFCRDFPNDPSCKCGSCEDQLGLSSRRLERLDKTLDAYEKATRLSDLPPTRSRTEAARRIERPGHRRQGPDHREPGPADQAADRKRITRFGDA